MKCVARRNVHSSEQCSAEFGKCGLAVAVQREAQPHRPLLHRHPCRASWPPGAVLSSGKLIRKLFFVQPTPPPPPPACCTHRPAAAPMMSCSRDGAVRPPPMLLLPLWRNNSVGSSNPGRAPYFGLQLQERRGDPAAAARTAGVQRAQSEADAVRATTCASRTLKVGFPLSPHFQRMGSQLKPWEQRKKGSFPSIWDFPY